MNKSIFKPYQPSVIKKPNVLRALVMIAGVTLILSALLLFISVNSAMAILLAMICFVLPQSYLSLKAFAHYGSGDIEKIKSSFYIGEFYKVVLSCALFVSVFLLAPTLNFLVFFLSYGVIAFVYVGLIQFQINHPS